VARWPDGDFGDFVAVEYGRLVRFALALTGDLGHAEDLVQTALMRTYLRGRPHEPVPYLLRALVNGNRSRIRRRGLTETLVAVPPDRAGEVAVGGEQGMEDVLAGLSRQQRAVLALRYAEGLSEAEIAATLRVTPGTVKKQAARAMSRLRERFDLPQDSRHG
jgi:RNA polymerase sigma factor (sigma-70 family)